MSGRRLGNLILMTLTCVVIFVVFMAFRPARSEEMPVYDANGHYAGSVFDYGKTQTYTDRSGHVYRYVVPKRLSSPDASGLSAKVSRGSNTLDLIIHKDGSAEIK